MKRAFYDDIQAVQAAVTQDEMKESTHTLADRSKRFIELNENCFGKKYNTCLILLFKALLFIEFTVLNGAAFNTARKTVDL